MKLLLAIALIFGYIVGLRVIEPAIDRIGERKAVHPVRIKYIVKTLKIGLTAGFFMALLCDFCVPLKLFRKSLMSCIKRASRCFPFLMVYHELFFVLLRSLF